MKKGDKVLVDINFSDGNCEAEVVWVGAHIAKIKADGVEWDVMKSKLTPIKKDK